LVVERNPRNLTVHHSVRKLQQPSLAVCEGVLEMVALQLSEPEFLECLPVVLVEKRAHVDIGWSIGTGVKIHGCASHQGCIARYPAIGGLC
jgi:hypothetical protein